MSRRSLLAAAAATFLLTACAGVSPRDGGAEPGTVGTIIDRAQIERSGARDAFEAVKRARTHLTIHDTGHARRPATIGSRGPSSLYLDNRVRVVVDGAAVFDGVESLRSISSKSIERIQVLTAREATTVYGTSGGNGVIVVTTSALVARR